MEFYQSEPALNSEPVIPEQPVIDVQPLSILQRREPFWDYVDLLMVIGIGFAFMVVFCFPMVFLLKPEAGVPRNLVAIAAALQTGLYLAVYLSIKAAFIFRHGVKSVFRSLGWRSTTFSLSLAAVGGVALAFVVSGIAALLHTPQVESPIEQFTKSPGAIIFIAALAITAAPIFEELFFRGLLQPLLSKSFGSAIGILLTAILFGALHLPEYSQVWQYGVAIIIVGIVLGYVRARSGSLIPSTIMHGCFNAVSVVALVLSKYVKH
jgi:membrane protease YdiL (CAAX protease family)